VLGTAEWVSTLITQERPASKLSPRAVTILTDHNSPQTFQADAGILGYYLQTGYQPAPCDSS